MEFKENRKNRRYAISLPVKIFVLLPEETFQPKEQQGRAQNISLNGMKILVPHVEEVLYKNLLKTVRFAKVLFTLPGSSRQMELHGRIVWIDYSSEEKSMELGVFLDRMIPEQQRTIQTILDRLETEKSSG
jgi:c-di-GMP-binding flagellar brake protein YcgR